VKNGSQFGFIGRTAPTAFIFELAFLTNPREAEILKSWNGSESLVYSHAKALLNTLGVQFDIKAGSKIML
jgi:N-acetylmuramoyl-L-alanine amidase